MGVQPCSRKNCERVMCDTYIPTIGYICNSCKEEFKEYLKANNLTPMTDRDIKRELENFIFTDKGMWLKGKEMTIDEFFNNHT